MKEFICTNKLITVFFLISIIIILSFPLNNITYFNIDKIYDLLNQLAIGYIINFIFYITQIYVPNRKKDYSAKQCVNIRIEKVINSMQDSIFKLNNLYNPSHTTNSTYTDDDLKKLMKLKFSDTIRVLKIENNNYFNVREWLYKCITETECEIDNLYRYYPNYISATLMKALENIINSNYHKLMKLFLKSKNDVDFSSSSDCFFIEYYKLIKDLKKIQESEYKI